jgi:hypothetical protein
MMRRLHLPIQEPCHENWDAMSQHGDAQRFCDVCVKQVHDLSALTEPQARTVLADASAKGRVCVRYKADRDGNIRFKPETVTASSLWRMTLAAAGMTLALLTGCTDTAPDRVLSDRCEYEVGPWGFTAERGQGTCPAVEPEPEILDETEILGQIMAEPPVLPEPERELMGDIPAVELQPEPTPVEEPRMGKIAMPEPVVEPEPKAKVKRVQEPELHQMMGGLALSPEMLQPEPCDPISPAPQPI